MQHCLYLPRWGSRGVPRAPLTPGLNTPKLNFLFPYLIVLYFFSLASLGIQFLSYFTIFHNLTCTIFQLHFAWHIICHVLWRHWLTFIFHHYVPKNPTLLDSSYLLKWNNQRHYFSWKWQKKCHNNAYFVLGIELSIEIIGNIL